MSQQIASVITASLAGMTDARGGIRWSLLREVAFSPDRLRVLLWQVCLYLVFFVFPFLRPGLGWTSPLATGSWAAADDAGRRAGFGRIAPGTTGGATLRPRPGHAGLPGRTGWMRHAS